MMKKPSPGTMILEVIRTEHQYGFQLCENIRKGLKNNVEPERIRSYTEWFSKNYLEPHFELEEKYIFPVLGRNVRVKRALANHRRIKRLLSCECSNEKVLNLLEEELGAYIRFEERILYNEIQKVAGAGCLAEIKKNHQELEFSDEDWNDRFWIS